MYQIKIGKQIKGVRETDEYKRAFREIYEVWAGSEGVKAETKTEAYQESLIKKMRDIAAKHM